MSDTLTNYFASIPASHRSLFLAGGIAFFWILESAVPLFRMNYRKLHHAAINLVFTGTTVAVNLALAFVLLLASNLAVSRDMGALQWLPDPPFWLFTLLGLLGLDLISAWLPHWIHHRVAWLWRLHLVHHTDRFVDTTSANRHHPGESVVRFAFTALAVLALGTPLWLVFLYQALSVAVSQFSHANIVLPRRLDHALSRIIVSPDMHKVHHHFLLPYTDSNYGNIFSIWDRLFGTFRMLERDQLVYGVDSHMAPEDHSHLGRLLILPFLPPRYRRP